ncbi:hypothetical protein [Kitasatospora sp. NPDC058046]|uniref:hypothetical protein n=1 Tax=Kitasatospora sp. NPDC058046 TaxID=3346312 RepID=UPI0036D8AC37
MTTYTAALERWRAPRNGDSRPPTRSPATGHRLLQDDLPTPPAGLPTQGDFLEIAHAAADRAQTLLNAEPLPLTPIDHAVHIAALRPGTPLEPAHRLHLDIGHWRELIATYRTDRDNLHGLGTDPRGRSALALVRDTEPGGASALRA